MKDFPGRQILHIHNLTGTLIPIIKTKQKNVKNKKLFKNKVGNIRRKKKFFNCCIQQLKKYSKMYNLFFNFSSTN